MQARCMHSGVSSMSSRAASHAFTSSSSVHSVPLLARTSSGAARHADAKRTTLPHTAPQRWAGQQERAPMLMQASSGGGASPGDDQGPKAISLLRRLPSIEYTFVLAGFLKILTIGSLAYSAPVDTLRTAAGQISPYLMVPVGLGMCFIAKVVVENNLQESRRFTAGLVAFLVFLYFGLYKLLYRYDPSAELPLRTKSVSSSSPVARVRAGAGDREIGGPEGEGIMLRSSRAYKQSKAGTYDDAAYFDGQYACQMEAPTRPRRQQEAGGDMSKAQGVSTAELDLRNPLRRQGRANAS